MKIQVQIKSVYGNEVVYPICPTAVLFAKLAKQKTLTSREIEIIKALGYQVEVVSQFKQTL